MKRFSWLLIALLLFDFGLLLYANRAALTTPFDAAYWKDRYEHSQWQLPLSPRTLGDNGLYAYEGYRLTGGADPTTFNAEIPPLGKYAIGAVIRLTGISAWYGVVSALTAIVLFFLLSKKILKDKTFALIVTTWFSFDLLFVSQWTATMLDVLQLASLLLFFLLLDSPVLAGIALGIFSGIKYPFFSVILLATGGFYLWKKTGSIRRLIVLGITALGTYVLTYLQYFVSGHSLFDWLRLQKFMFAFWKGSTLAANAGSIWTTLLFNRYQNLFTKAWETVPEWSLSWPIILILTTFAAYRTRKNLWFVIIWISVFLFMIFYTIVPFWTRYLLLIVPFLYIGAAAAVRSIRSKPLIILVTVLLLVCNAAASWRGIFPTPESDIQQFVYDWKNGFFQDMYERFTAGTKAKTDRYTFLRTMQKITRDGEIEATNIQVVSPPQEQFASPQYVSLAVTYSTRYLGEFTENVRLPVLLENGVWRIPWKQEYYISGLSLGDELKTTVIPARNGSLIRSGVILAADFPSYMVWVTPQDVDQAREQEMLHYLEMLFGGPPGNSAVNIYHRYAVNNQPDWPAPIGVLPHPITPAIRDMILSFRGITLTPTAGRETHAMEQAYINRLKGENGGTLSIIDSHGNIIKTLMSKEKKDGEDVSL